ncbi:hypothetical protein CVT24_008986 [Panaeolus cyanescens]|uniref:Rhodopsin domain-containing protein n=1 Tax=Panaeolus cyanescens TaxID=181874 RepID=A0A409YAQ1_9AGAR|nr:hypothetical protein CVT24_008986 [Panaeolus cyanescens]
MTVLWVSRMSLAFSVARLFPRRPEKKVGIALGSLCLGCCMASLIITAFTCRPRDRPWYWMDGASCIRSGNGHIIGGLSLLSIEIGADIILIAYPLLVLWKVSLPKSQRMIIMAALCGSVLTIMATVVLAVFWYSTWNLGPDFWLISTGVANIEGAIALFVCNLLFITMFFYRYFHRNNASGESTEAPTSNRRDTEAVTTDPNRRITTLPESSLNISFTDIILQSSLYAASCSIHSIGNVTPRDSNQSEKQDSGHSDNSNTRLTSS